MTIGIIGLGYVGLPLAVAFGEAGHDVVRVDTDARVVEGLAAGHSRVEDVPSERLAALAHHDPHVAEVGELDLASVPLVVDFRGVTRGITAENLIRL